MSEENLGSLFAISCAVIWSLTVILYKGVTNHLGANAFNLVKNTIALVLLTLTIFLVGDYSFKAITAYDFWLLFASGVIGLGFADALFLTCLKKVGAGWMAIVETAYTPFVFILAFSFLGESITWNELIGMSVIIVSLLFMNFGLKLKRTDDYAEFRQGILAGILSLFLVAGGVVMTKYSLGRVSLLYAVEIRLLGGVLACLVILFCRKNWRLQLKDIALYPSRSQLFWISVIGTYLTLILWVAGFKYQKASIVAVLNQTSTIFTLFASVIFLKESLSKRKLIAGVCAFCGVVVTVL